MSVKLLLLGSAGDLITISDRIITGSSVATYALLNTGDLSNQAGVLGTWISPQINMALYECFVASSSVTGDGISGTVDTWLSLGTTRSWSRPASGSPKLTGFIVQIRPIGASTTAASANITLDASGGA